MDLKGRIVAGALGGFVSTLVLVVFRKALAATGVVYTTAPEQVVTRLEEVGVLDRFSPAAKRVITYVAHFLYGISIGVTFGALRRTDEEPESETAAELQGDREDSPTEAAVGVALGVLSWGAGWAAWLPITGVHPAPWTQKTPRALLPIVDHAVYGATWGLIYWTLTRRRA
jgi:hypothetical protein